MIKKLAEILKSINSKKEQMTRLQKEVEIKISDLDKLLDEIAKLDNPSTNAKVKQLHKTQKS